MKVTVEQTLPASVVDAFYPMYVAAFDPLRTVAAARHVLSAEEFAAEMADPRIDKYVVWDDEDMPVAMTTLATDLAAVPWISPEYFAAKYPEHLARGAVFYLGYTLVAPGGRRRPGVFPLMIQRMMRRLIEANAVCGFDVCAHNDTHGIGRQVAAMCRAGNADIAKLDTQTYYSFAFSEAA
jgi:hypothetical protein